MSSSQSNDGTTRNQGIGGSQDTMTGGTSTLMGSGSGSAGHAGNYVLSSRTINSMK